MKKLLVLVAALVGLASCSQKERFVNVRFGVDVDWLETKGINAMLSELRPELKNVEFTVGNNYGVKIGDELTLLEGIYEVTGEYAPWNGLSFGGHRVAERQAFIVADEVEVNACDYEILATADWNCWVLVVVNSEVSDVTFDGVRYSMGGYSKGDLGVFFVEACQGSEWVLRLVPSDSDTNKNTEWTIEADERGRAGKWYLYHPDGRVEVSGGFGLNFQEWTEGEV